MHLVCCPPLFTVVPLAQTLYLGASNMIRRTMLIVLGREVVVERFRKICCCCGGGGLPTVQIVRVYSYGVFFFPYFFFFVFYDLNFRFTIFFYKFAVIFSRPPKVLSLRRNCFFWRFDISLRVFLLLFRWKCE